LAACQTLDHQPRSSLPSGKKQRDHLIQLAIEQPPWALGFGDEVWWSRLAQAPQHRWVEGRAVTRLQELTCAKGDPGPKALACYGLLVLRTRLQAEPTQRRCVAGRPVSAVTTAFLAWCCDCLAEQGITALLLTWDNASWHTSQAVRSWIRTHNQRVKASQRGVRMIACWLPVKSPWLNPIEPKWVHDKWAVSEPNRLLSAAALAARVCMYYACTAEAHVLMPKKAA
jgi:hypothetical protein